MSDEKVSQRYKESLVYEVQSGRVLLQQSAHKKYMDWLKVASGLNDSLFNELYLPLVCRFGDYVQTLQQTGLHWDDSSFNYGLARAKAILKMNDKALSKKDKTKQALLRYLVFSAGLLYEVGLVAADRKIFICNEKGEFVKLWEPLLGSLASEAHYYKVRNIGDLGYSYMEAITPLLAKGIMPDAGLVWLNESPNLLLVWLKSLVNPEDGFSDLGLTFEPEEIKKRTKKGRLEDLMVKVTEPEDTLAGELFWKWLKEQIESKKISLNKDDSMAHLVQEGLLLEHEKIFRDFTKTYSQYRDWIVVYKQFNHLGLTRLSGQDYKFEQYFSDSPYKTVARKTSMFSKSNLLMKNKSIQKSSKGLFSSKLESKEPLPHNNPLSKSRQMQGHLLLNPHMFVNPAALGAVNTQMKTQSKGFMGRLLTRLLVGTLGVNMASNVVPPK